MGGGNGQKSKMARERNLEKQKGNKGSFFFFLVFFEDYNKSITGSFCFTTMYVQVHSCKISLTEGFRIKFSGPK